MILPGLLSDRIADVEAEFEALWESAVSMDLQDNAAAVPRRGQVMYAGELSTSSKCITAFIDRSPRLACLLDDPRVRALGAALLGDDWSFTGSDGNLYRGTTGWHSDGYNKTEMQHIKLAVYLDTLTPSNGALRVIPGSHVAGDAFSEALDAQLALKPSGSAYKLEPDAVPAVPLPSSPGDVIVFDHNLKRKCSRSLCVFVAQKERLHRRRVRRLRSEKDVYDPDVPTLPRGSPATVPNLSLIWLGRPIRRQSADLRPTLPPPSHPAVPFAARGV